jgi:N-acetylglucosaminyl-diphospho-decaprenol L-rhamnosyltransferase
VKLLVIVLNYKTTRLTIDCLQSLEREIAARPDAAAAVVENGSGDDAAQQLRETIDTRAWNPWVELIPLGENLGFTAGNNLVMRRALASPDPPEYFLLLNSDTVVLPGAVDALVRFMDEHPRAGIAGSRLEFPTGLVQGSPFRFQGLLSELDRGLAVGPFSRVAARWTVYRPKPCSASPVDWVAGASMMLRSETIGSAGLLDEGFFAYFEDMDYCLTARRHGWQTWYVPESRVIHLEGASSQIRQGPYATPPRYWFQARTRYFQKNHGAAQAMLVDSALIAGCSIGYIYAILRRRQPAESLGKLKDAMRHSVFAGGLRRP